MANPDQPAPPAAPPAAPDSGTGGGRSVGRGAGGDVSGELTPQRLVELSRAAAAGDATAFSDLHRRFSAGLVRLFLKRCGGDQDLSEDLAQRTWTLVWNAVRMGRYDPGKATLSTFVYAVGNNVWLQHLRRAGKAGRVAALSEEAGEALPDDSVRAESELIQAVRAAMSGEQGAGLSEQERAIVRWAGEGLSDRDLAERLGLAPSTANVKKRAAFEKIKRFLASKGFRGLHESHGPESPGDGPGGTRG